MQIQTIVASKVNRDLNDRRWFSFHGNLAKKLKRQSAKAERRAAREALRGATETVMSFDQPWDPSQVETPPVTTRMAYVAVSRAPGRAAHDLFVDAIEVFPQTFYVSR